MTRQKIGAAPWIAIAFAGVLSATATPVHAATVPDAAQVPTVLPITIMPVTRAAAVLHELFPHAKIRVDRQANSLIVVDIPNEVQEMRTVLQGIDVRSPTTPKVEVIRLTTLPSAAIVKRLRAIFPRAQIAGTGPHSLLVRADQTDLDQIKSLVSQLDQPPTTPTPTPNTQQTEAVRVTQARPADLARAIGHELRHLKVAVAGSSIVLSGAPDDIARAKQLATQLDLPPFGSAYTQVYRIK
ncbi:MAG: hypothetical protein ACREM6_00030, partial [Vulcanimicrobiaceae bacterium]